MTDWELILTMIGEKATKDITINNNLKDFANVKIQLINAETL